MKKMTIMLLALMLALGVGTAAAEETKTYTLEEMLVMALNDEYAAKATYEAILQKHGQVRPFVNLVRAETNHMASLTALFAAHGLTAPINTAKGEAPDTLEEALAQAQKAEQDNIAMYDAFLKQENLPADVATSFANLQRASYQHLSALQNVGQRGRRNMPLPAVETEKNDQDDVEDIAEEAAEAAEEKAADAAASATRLGKGRHVRQPGTMQKQQQGRKNQGGVYGQRKGRQHQPFGGQGTQRYGQQFGGQGGQGAQRYGQQFGGQGGQPFGGQGGQPFGGQGTQRYGQQFGGQGGQGLGQQNQACPHCDTCTCCGTTAPSTVAVP